MYIYILYPMSHSVKPLGLHQAFKCHVPKLHAWSLFQNSWAQAEVLQCAPSGPQGEVNMPSADPAVAVVGEKAGSTYIYIYLYQPQWSGQNIYKQKEWGSMRALHDCSKNPPIYQLLRPACGGAGQVHGKLEHQSSIHWHLGGAN